MLRHLVLPGLRNLLMLSLWQEAESEGETTVVFADDDSSLDGVLNLTAAETGMLAIRH